MNEEFNKLVKEYTSQEHCEEITQAVRQAGKAQDALSFFEQAEQALTDWLVEKLYITDAEAVASVQVFTKCFDYDRRLSMSFTAHIEKYGEPDMGRLLLFIACEIRRAKSAEDHWFSELWLIERRLANWPVGDTRSFKCVKCSGLGSIDAWKQDELESVQCTDCDGTGNILLERKVIT